ncbi:MAG: transcription antitermination factor NusB [Ignavibacteria bacterium]|nr:transcription antitermination factor NusB [Ignavibacteria bacterium]
MEQENKSIRRLLREKAVQALYAFTFNSEGRENLIRGFLTDVNDEPAREFFRSLVDRVAIHQKEFDEIISAHAKNWELERITVIDRCILRVGLCELLYFSDIPPKVTMNECIELSKVFGTDESSKFINGLLDKMHSTLVSQKKVNKIGRGLIDKSGSAE